MQFNTKKPKGQGLIHPISDKIDRLIANNASPFTFTGTATYIIGQKDVAILDPGPTDDKDHLALIMKAVDNRPVKAIIVSHTHIDHSPLARELKELTGAPIAGALPYIPPKNFPFGLGLDSSHDRGYQPDQVLQDGELLEGYDWCLETISTPGHAANHLSFAFKNSDYLFSADHVMGWSTTIVAPPDGNMTDYIASLDKIYARDETTYLPGHGGRILNAHRFVKAIKSHRLMRENVIMQKLSDFSKGFEISKLVTLVYPDIDDHLIGAATLSTFSHLEKLISEGRVVQEFQDEDPRYRLKK